MNYRHIYHAGNFADVFKHVILMLLIEHMQKKEKPLSVIDAHAGIGFYDLTSVEAGKTLEYRDGVQRLLDMPRRGEILERFATLIRELTAYESGDLNCYPGSPYIARHLLRAGDRLQLNELHPADFETLSANFNRDKQTVLHHLDAYKAMKALLPPTPRRGVVLLDPPFEVTDEFNRLLDGLKQAFKRWDTGCYAIWYPLKSREPVDKFHRKLAASGIRKVLNAEIQVAALDDEHLHGCGMTIINPPWKLDDELRAIMPELKALLARASGAVSSVQWVVPE